MDGGFGFEFVTQITVSLKNYFSRDPKNANAIGED